VPKSPTDITYCSGLVSGEDTRKETMGAHGTDEAIAPSTTAVVPHEQNGVSAPSATAASTATHRRLRIHVARNSGLSKTCTVDATTTLASR